MSRLAPSVPMRCASDGAAFFRVTIFGWYLGSYGAMRQGIAIAAITTPAITIERSRRNQRLPMRAALLRYSVSVITAQPWIEHAIQNIGGDTAHDDERTRENHR